MPTILLVLRFLFKWRCCSLPLGRIMFWILILLSYLPEWWCCFLLVIIFLCARLMSRISLLSCPLPCLCLPLSSLSRYSHNYFTKVDTDVLNIHVCTYSFLRRLRSAEIMLGSAEKQVKLCFSRSCTKKYTKTNWAVQIFIYHII